MSNFIRQNEVNIANQPLKFEQPLLKSSGEIDKLPCFTNILVKHGNLSITEHSPETIITVIGTNFPSRALLVIESIN